jgi:hypothetical protein
MRDSDEPIRAMPISDRLELSRANFLSDSDELIVAKSSTDSADPSRAKLRREIEAPK